MNRLSIMLVLVIYLDTTYLSIKCDTVAKEALYFAIGITPDGYKEILSYNIYPTESAYNWESI